MKYEKSDKRMLYYLMDELQAKRISEGKFCDEFYFSYNLSLDKRELSEKESIFFEKLSQVASRFSEHEEDHQLDPRAFASKAELHEQLEVTIKNLAEEREQK